MRKLDEDEMVFIACMSMLLIFLILGTQVVGCERHRIDLNAKVDKRTEAPGL